MPSRTSCPQAPSAPRFEDGTPGPRLRPQPPRRTSPTSAPSVPAPESPERAKSKAPVISTHRVPGHARRHRVSARTRKPGVLHEVEDEANHPANLHLAPSGTYQPTAPRRARRIRECAEQNRSSAAYRQGRLRTQPADHLAEQNADHHRVRAEQYLDEPTERASRIQTGQRAQRHAVTYAPSGNIDRTTRSHAPSNRPSQGHRAAAPHDAFFHRRAAEGAQTTSTSSPRSGGRCQPHQFRHLAPSGTFQQTAPRQAHTPRTTAPSTTPTTTESAPSGTLRSEDTERSAILRRYARAPAVLPRPTETNTSTSPPSVPAPECQATLKTAPLATSKTDPRRNGVCRRV